MIRVQTWAAPLAASATSLVNAHALDGSTLTTVTAQPDFARLLQLVASGATTANVTVNGTDINGAVITEVVALNGTTKVNTLNAYATVTSVVLPTVGATTISVGIDTGLGMDSLCDYYSFTGFSGVSSSSFNTTVISKNYIVSSTTLNASNNVSASYIPAQFPSGRAWG